MAITETQNHLVAMDIGQRHGKERVLKNYTGGQNI